MAFVHYLAMTPAELSSRPLPDHPAWMACHFSGNVSGVTDLPKKIPLETLLILNDRIPGYNADPDRIIRELLDTVTAFTCPALLLDFQRPAKDSVRALAAALAQALPCPVPAPPEYAAEGQPIFLPPVPPDIPLQDYISPWQSREIWLETALNSAGILMTEDGSRHIGFSARGKESGGFSNDRLHCHYAIELNVDTPVFTLWRTPEDLRALLAEAETLGVHAAVGLYQELGSLGSPAPGDA